MRTKIACGWLVGNENGRHVLWRDAELVYEDDRVIFIGKSFEGVIDREIDACNRLVAPGFIDTHVHSGHRASHRLISDVGRPDYFGQPFLEISVPRHGTRVGGDPRYARPNTDGAREDLALNATFTVAELLRKRIGTTRSVVVQPRSCATASRPSSSSAANAGSKRRCTNRSGGSASGLISVRASIAGAGLEAKPASWCA